MTSEELKQAIKKTYPEDIHEILWMLKQLKSDTDEPELWLAENSWVKCEQLVSLTFSSLGFLKKLVQFNDCPVCLHRGDLNNRNNVIEIVRTIKQMVITNRLQTDHLTPKQHLIIAATKTNLTVGNPAHHPGP